MLRSKQEVIVENRWFGSKKGGGNQKCGLGIIILINKKKEKKKYTKAMFEPQPHHIIHVVTLLGSCRLHCGSRGGHGRSYGLLYLSYG